MPKIIDANIQLPILVERIEPNPIIVPKPTLISKTSSSIEVEQTFQCDVDYYGGVGIEQNGDVDANLCIRYPALNLVLILYNSLACATPKDLT